MVLPNGPEMAATFLGVVATARCAPLDPTSTVAEARAALTDLDAAAVVLVDGVDSGARQAADELGVARLELSLAPEEPAGLAALTPVGGGVASGVALEPGPDDVALLLRTSGTTARPKQVPLTHANLLASAANVAGTLALSERDRCLNLMPLFHIHGLVACLGATLWAGGSVVCTPGFDRAQILDWFEEVAPTWYSAVPTIQQAVLGAAAGREDGRRWGLRFIRSSSAPLPPQVLARLEATFDAPVVEAYGMTEAAHQIASNPLPPGVRKPGTVGRPAGPEVAVLDEDGVVVPAGVVGEIAIRGRNVTAGYLDDAAANAAAFAAEGWLRTGDQGVFDEDGYLTITGRLKELINRGGEKIAPREVEEALLDHPAVAEALAFGVPHPTLGEDVAAAVVLREDEAPEELRRFAGRSLGPHKVPRQLVVVDAIPRGATGKPQRRGAAEALGLTAGPAPAPGVRRSALEAALAGLWSEVLGIDRIEPDDDFFVLGGDSLSALELSEHVREVFGVELTTEVLAGEGATLAGMARFVDASRGRTAGPVSSPDVWQSGARVPRAPLRRPRTFVPSLTERWHGDLRLIVDEGASRLGITLAFSDRSGGVSGPPFDSLNLSLQRGDSPNSVLENRRRLADAAGFDVYSLAVSRPVFGTDVIEVGRRDRGMLGTGDALVARTSGPVLGLFHADCAPVVVAGRGGVVLAHVAADSLAAGLVERAVAAVAPGWVAWVGPSVRGCCHDIDVPVAVADALRGAGVAQVAVWPDCTSCDERYFSRRRTETTGRQGAFVGIRADVNPWERARDLAARGRAAARRRLAAAR